VDETALSHTLSFTDGAPVGTGLYLIRIFQGVWIPTPAAILKVNESPSRKGGVVSTIGAEMGQLQSLGQSFTRESQDVARLVAAISSQVNSTWWKGPAADRFRASWESEFAPTLRRLEAALHQASGEISRRHEALLQAGS
jgi:uncharacterized protein YukE